LPTFDELHLAIDQAFGADRFRLRRRLRGIEQSRDAGKPFDRSLARLAEEIAASVELRSKRAAGLPEIRYEDDLPILAKRDEIVEAIRLHPAVVVCGETGSGKSTQLPKICLEMGRGLDGVIGHTQPRRIAARSVAARLSQELRTSLGDAVGFKIRFADVTRPETYVKLMTDGILLTETQSDRFLNQYDTLILDEAHERSLNIDFLLGYLKRLLGKREDLRVIITSATIDAARFAEHFASERGPAPVIEVSGRTYPVEVRYRPPAGEEDEDDLDPSQAIATAVDELSAEGPGDMLVFLPTERDIREVAKSLRGHFTRAGDRLRDTEILPLYARLSAAEQNRIFQPHGKRRIVLATNVAESSLTVPGIRYVIDTGTARISRYSARSKVQRLPIEPVSQASADQRKGRCGRIGPGICIRLYREDDYLARDRYTTPEIRRTNLASVILQTTALRLGAIEEVPFLDPPRPEHIRDGYKTLFELGAIDDDQQLTEAGRQLARLPVDPRIGRMILAAANEGSLHEVLIIAAALEVRDPRERPADKQQAADERHAQFAHEESDFLGYLTLWDFYHRLKENLSRNQLHRACHDNFLSHNRLREWADIHRQLLEMVRESGLRPGPRRHVATSSPACPPIPGNRENRHLAARAPAGKLADRGYDAIHRAILAGLLSNVALRGDGYEYTGAGGLKFHLWPGSGVFGKKPKWVIAAELLETSRRYLRTIARVDPEWIEPLAEHLVKRSYSDPHWSRKSASAMAFEKVTLFGLPIVQRRRVRLGPIDPKGARELFVEHALVQEDYETRAAFFHHNRETLEEIQSLGAKSRRRDFVVEDYARFRFYDSRIPETVTDGQSFEKWRRQAERENPKLLCMTHEDLLGDLAPDVQPADFPDAVEIDRVELPLDYRFEPGAENDGVTLVVPREGLARLRPERLGWLVPGLLEEKIIALIRGLPKPIRRNLVPIPETAKKVLAELSYGEGPFLVSLSAAIKKVTGEHISPDAFPAESLPQHLRMNVRVVDDAGKTVAAGRDVAELRKELGAEAEAAPAEIRDEAWRREGITSWDFDELQQRIEVERGGVTLPAWPALLDGGSSVSLRLLDSPERAALESRAGIRRLFVLAERRELKAQVDWMPQLKQWSVLAAPICGAAELRNQLVDLLADRTFLRPKELPRTRSDFEERRKSHDRLITPAVQEVAQTVDAILNEHHAARLALENASAKSWQYAIDDVQRQLSRLTHADFLTRTPWEWLVHLPRYLRGIRVRLDKLASGAQERDRRSYAELAPRENAYLQRLRDQQAQGVYDLELARYRWMLEEFRISLFAQELGTAFSISAKRLDKQWEKLRT
jgi:ATP-dependent helicase HrpA